VFQSQPGSHALPGLSFVTKNSDRGHPQLRNPPCNIRSLGYFRPAERSFCKSEYFADAFEYTVDFLSGGGASEAETDGTFPDVIRDAHRLQHRR
jgi:hypothetical protein